MILSFNPWSWSSGLFSWASFPFSNGMCCKSNVGFHVKSRFHLVDNLCMEPVLCHSDFCIRVHPQVRSIGLKGPSLKTAGVGRTLHISSQWSTVLLFTWPGLNSDCYGYLVTDRVQWRNSSKQTCIENRLGKIDAAKPNNGIKSLRSHQHSGTGISRYLACSGEQIRSFSILTLRSMWQCAVWNKEWKIRVQSRFNLIQSYKIFAPVLATQFFIPNHLGLCSLILWRALFPKNVTSVYCSHCSPPSTLIRRGLSKCWCRPLLCPAALCRNCRHPLVEQHLVSEFRPRRPLANALIQSSKANVQLARPWYIYKLKSVWQAVMTARNIKRESQYG